MSDQRATWPRQSYKLQQIYWDAVRYCDWRYARAGERCFIEEVQQVEMALRYQAFLREIEPLMELKTRWLSLQPSLGTILLREDGSFSPVAFVKPAWWAEIDELIDNIRRSYEL